MNCTCWNSYNEGPIPIEEMELSHLQNTIAYLYRKKKEWEGIRKVIQSKGKVSGGQVTVQDKPIQEWLNILCSELIRREKGKNQSKQSLRKIFGD